MQSLKKIKLECDLRRYYRHGRKYNMESKPGCPHNAPERYQLTDCERHVKHCISKTYHTNSW
jgi:hypothetical protein